MQLIKDEIHYYRSGSVDLWINCSLTWTVLRAALSQYLTVLLYFFSVSPFPTACQIIYLVVTPAFQYIVDFLSAHGGAPKKGSECTFYFVTLVLPFIAFFIGQAWHHPWDHFHTTYVVFLVLSYLANCLSVSSSTKKLRMFQKKMGVEIGAMGLATGKSLMSLLMFPDTFLFLMIHLGLYYHSSPQGYIGFQFMHGVFLLIRVIYTSVQPFPHPAFIFIYIIVNMGQMVFFYYVVIKNLSGLVLMCINAFFSVFFLSSLFKYSSYIDKDAIEKFEEMTNEYKGREPKSTMSTSAGVSV